MPTFNYTVDDEAQSTTAHELTADQILRAASIDPSNHYLVQIEGNHRTSYENKATQEIHIHEHMKFVSISTGPTTVSR